MSPTSADALESARQKLTVREYGALRSELRRQLAAELAARPARPTRIRETPEVAAAARRMIRAVGERAALDVEALPLLAQLRGQVDAELQRAVDGARDPGRQSYPYSWADVGRALGLTKQGAQQRFGRST